MYILHSIIVGALGKIYDDIEDLHIPVNTFIVDSLKTLIIASYVLLSYNDLAFSIVTLFMSIFTYGIDNSFWKSFIPLSFFMTILSYYTSDKAICVPLLIFFILFGIILSNIEDRVFKEEASYRKLYTRLGGLIALSILYFSPILPLIHTIIPNTYFIEKIVLICIGGLFASIISQVLQLHIDTFNNYKDSIQYYIQQFRHLLAFI